MTYSLDLIYGWLFVPRLYTVYILDSWKIETVRCGTKPRECLTNNVWCGSGVIMNSREHVG